MDHMIRKKRWLLSGVALLIAAFHLIPFYILITTALKSRGNFSSVWVFPKEMNFANFAEAWEMASLGNALANTSIITSISAILLIIFGSLAVYPLARRHTNSLCFLLQ